MRQGVLLHVPQGPTHAVHCKMCVGAALGRVGVAYGLCYPAVPDMVARCPALPLGTAAMQWCLHQQAAMSYVGCRTVSYIVPFGGTSGTRRSMATARHATGSWPTPSPAPSVASRWRRTGVATWPCASAGRCTQGGRGKEVVGACNLAMCKCGHRWKGVNTSKFVLTAGGRGCEG